MIRLIEIAESQVIEDYEVDLDIINICRIKRQPQCKVYVPKETAVVVGRGGKAHLEVNLEACQSDSVPVVRRPGGGCAVVIDPGNVIISVVLPTEGIEGNKQYFDRLSQWVIDRLAEAGITNVYQDGISDLVIDDHKIGGSSIYRNQDYLYYSTTILANPQLHLIDRYLQHPPKEPPYRRNRSHREFLGTLSVKFGEDYSAQLLADSLKKSISSEQLISLI
ncbi:hypothetical protein CEE37_00405 [candidate division LCP-89 bacterium B3_LCP]|uniref:BPL/LPL catalytic domain-containing protein n=1 Tax=candidate division LCP-89 bacterium B3_LCP TaxID=2012998 RepID=A0A532V4U8_UNCL8|nr:MAG: hypothetical protein CEE37_00405 [candidate division LCP-89 bacterium B3_LCP]